MLPIRREELRAFTTRVENLQDEPMEGSSNAGYFWLAVAATLVVSLLTFTQSSTQPDDWIVAAFLTVAAMSGVVARYCFKHDAALRRSLRKRVGQLVTELRALEARYPRGGQS
jgi:hypothetical protein